MKTTLRRSAIVTLAAATFLDIPASRATALQGTTLGVEGRSNATPWVAAHNSFVAVVWGASVDGKTDVFLAVSRDRGETFGAAVQVNARAGEARLGGEMPPRVALVPTRSGAPDIVVLWTARSDTTQIRIARSRDAGRTFAAPSSLQAAGAPGDRGWTALAVDAQGTGHAIWLDHRGLATAKTQGATHDHKNSAYDGVAMAQKSGLYYARADASRSAERELTPGVCYCCKTALAIAPDGALYAAWRHVYPGNVRDIAMTVSRDQGRTFAGPVRVSEDEWQLNGCPDDGPALAVDASGVVHVVWPTVIGGPTPEGALFYSTTRDGRTFTPRVRVPTLGSPKPAHPQLVVDDRGRVTVAWDELVNGKRVAVARRLMPGHLQRTTADAPIMLASDQTSAMYPVLAVTPDGLIAVWTTGATGASTIGVRRLSR